MQRKEQSNYIIIRRLTIHEIGENSMTIEAFPDVSFYQKVSALSENAVLLSKKATQSEVTTIIYNFHRKAMQSFLNRDYLSSIFFSSIGVETYLNSDKRLEDYRKRNKRRNEWLNLNLKTIRKAKENGLPTIELLDQSEFPLLDEKRPSNRRPVFCLRRNKILHGDLEGLAKEGAKIGIPEIEFLEKRRIGRTIRSTYFFLGAEAAYDQLLKFQRFCLKLTELAQGKLDP